MYSLLSKAELMSNDKTKIIVKWSKIKDKVFRLTIGFMGLSFFFK